MHVNSSQNKEDLTAELRLLAYGQYFAESFAKRARMTNVEIPSLIVFAVTACNLLEL